MSYTYNPFTKNLDAYGMTSGQILSYWLKDGSNGPATGDWDLGNHILTVGEGLFTRPISFTYNGSGQLTGVARTGGTSKVLAYNTDGTLHTVYDGTRTETCVYVGTQLTTITVS